MKNCISEYLQKVMLYSVACLTLTCTKPKPFPERHPDQLINEHSFWITPQWLQETGIARVIPQRELEKCLIAEEWIISNLPPEGNRYIAVSIELPSAGLSLLAHDGLQGEDNTKRGPDRRVDWIEVYLTTKTRQNQTLTEMLRDTLNHAYTLRTWNNYPQSHEYAPADTVLANLGQRHYERVLEKDPLNGFIKRNPPSR